MICSIFTLGKTVQDITREILYIINNYEYPDTPFIIKGYENPLLAEVNRLQTEIISLKNLMELWYENRILEKWEIKDIKQSQEILYSLRTVKLGDIILCNILDDEIVNSEDYQQMLISYIIKLNKIKASVSKWVWYLFLRES